MGFEIGKTVAGYEVVEVLGGSKIGMAYKVRNVFAQRFEILKILPKGLQDDEEQIARFLREIKVHARLVHPNIVTFYNAREIEGQLVMTTEFVAGETVAERIEAGPMPWRGAVTYAGQALAALEYAHEHGVIHRGLTASSLVITADGTVRLSGFGLAKVVNDPQLTAVGTVIGALRYISPEQVKGLTVDARCDVYSLCAVLYEMLTGKLPFESKGQFEIMLAHVNTPPKHPSDVTPEVPRELGDIVLKALAKEPEQRFQNAREFRAALESLDLGTNTAIAPVQAAPPAVAKDATVLVKAATASANDTPPVNGKPANAPTNATPVRADAPAPPTSSQPMHPIIAALASGDLPPAEAVATAKSGSFLGNFFFSKVGISLAACIITFLLGSMALLALLAIAKP